VRALGVGVGYALANSIFGGTAPLIYQAMKARDQVPLFIAYVTVCIAISLVVYIFFLKNKSETYLDREQGAAFR
jgi:MHS family alpha-ketoglutarate permease-like MFS transporter